MSHKKFWEESEAAAEAEAYCRQPAGTLNPGTGPRWDPWPYICSMSRSLLSFVFPFVDPPYSQGGVGVAYFPLIRHRPHRKRRVQRMLFTTAETCLQSSCLATIRGIYKFGWGRPHRQQRNLISLFLFVPKKK
jgi:hypothetical protein